MSDAVTAAADRELQMLGSMVDCAHRLGMTFGGAAEAEADLTAKLQLLDAFHRSFQAVRMGIRLSMTLCATPKPAAAAAVPRERPERERLEVERSDVIERLEVEPIEAERERDRDYEPVSLPRFLATLGVVAADAGRLRDHLPADATQTLPILSDLLARAKAGPPGPALRPASHAPANQLDVLVRPPSTMSRAALLGSASAPTPVALRGPRLARPPPRPPR